jgi:hypothetical protein
MCGQLVRLQKSMDVLGQLRSDPLGRGNLFHARAAQPFYRAKLSQQQILAVLTHARAVIEDTFFNSLPQQQPVIGVREPMRLVANALQQMQRAGILR